MNNLKTNIRNNLIKQRNSLSINIVREYSDSKYHDFHEYAKRSKN